MEMWVPVWVFALSLLLHLTLPRPCGFLSVRNKALKAASTRDRKWLLMAREQENPTTGNRASAKYYCPQRPRKGVDIYAEPVPWYTWSKTGNRPTLN